MLQTHTALDARIAGLIASGQPGRSLEQPFYTDPEIFHLDLERVFRRYWIYAGHVSRIPGPGDYFTCSLGQDSLIIIRGDDDQVYALWNVCRHRGSQICDRPSGHVKKLVCPYHQWVYEKDGALLSARLMPEDFDKSEFGLYHAPVRVMEGLIFVSFVEEPPDFTPVERDCLPHLIPYDLEKTRICCTRLYDVHSNWKLITENFRECYHCGGGHPEYCHAVIGSSLSDPPERVRAVYEDRKRHWESRGLETGTVNFHPDTWHHCTRYPFQPGMVSESLDGQPVAPLLGSLKDRDAGVFAIVLYPGFWLEASSDYVWTMRVTPVSPTLCEVESSWLVREDAAEGIDYEVDRVTAFWRATGEQDWKLCEDNQAGVNSHRYRPGPYAPSESGIETFIQWYLNQLTG